MQSPYQTDYFAVGPDKRKDNTCENPDGAKKNGVFGTAVKFAVGAAAIGLAIFGLVKGMASLLIFAGVACVTSATSVSRSKV